MQARPGWACWFTPGRFALILAVLIAAVFPDVLLGARSFFYRDYGVLAYPTIYHYRESFWRGELPLWNPLSNCGVPFLAQWGTMTLYPGSLVYLLLPLPWSLGCFCLAHLWFAGLGMYCLARRWTGNEFAAAVAGVAFLFSGLTFSCLLWPNYAVALAWMPWVVLLGERAWAEGGRWVAWAALAGAMQMLSGVPELILITWLLLAVPWLAVWSKRTVKASLLTGRAVVFFTLVLGLTAAQTLPFFELLAHSQRDRSFATARWALPVWGWANLFVPLFHCYRTDQGIFFQHGQEFFSSVYLGIAPLALAVGACLGSGLRKPRVLAALGLLGIALALGQNGVLHDWLRRVLPLAGLARYPVKFLLLTGFAVPLLAAFAVRQALEEPSGAEDRQHGGWPRSWWGLGWALVIILVTLGLTLYVARHDPLPLDRWPATWRNGLTRAGFLMAAFAALAAVRLARREQLKSVAGLGLLALLWLDVLTAVPQQNPTLPSARLKPGRVDLAPRPSVGQGRVLILPWAEEVMLLSRVAGFEPDFTGKRLALWSNLNLLEQMAKINGSATLQVREQAQVQSLLYATPETELPRLVDFLGGIYATSSSNAVVWVPRPTAHPLITGGQEPVFVPPGRLPQVLAKPEFDGLKQVFLPLEAKATARATETANVGLAKQAWSAQRVAFEAEADRPAWVVVAQSYYPAWRARVDGHPARLWRANHAFQALEVPAGRSRIELVYHDTWFRGGLAVSFGSLLVMLVWVRQRP